MMVQGAAGGALAVTGVYPHIHIHIHTHILYIYDISYVDPVTQALSRGCTDVLGCKASTVMLCS